MAASDFYLRYRSMTNDELVTEKARLVALDSGFLTMGMGTKQFAIATSQNNDKLNAVCFVQRERGYSVPEGPRDVKNTMVGTVSFENV